PCSHVVQLHVEDEERWTCALSRRRRFRRLDFGHVEEPSEHRIHGNERGRHSPAGTQKVAPGEPEFGRQTSGRAQNPILYFSLCRGLRQRRKLLVRHQPSRKWDFGAQTLAHALAHPECEAIRLQHWTPPSMFRTWR